MRVWRPPYTVEEIEATPYEFGGPFSETRRGKMWQARLDYWQRMQRIFATLTVIWAIVCAVFVVLWLVH